MNLPELVLTLASLFAVALVWITPHHYAQDLVAFVTLVAITLLSSLSALWLLAITLGTAIVMHCCDKYRATATAIWCSLLGAMLLIIREIPIVSGSPVVWIGASYFTLRQIHILMEWWLNRSPSPTLRTLLHYNLFAPVSVSYTHLTLPTIYSV